MTRKQICGDLEYVALDCWIPPATTAFLACVLTFT